MEWTVDGDNSNVTDGGRVTLMKSVRMRYADG